MSASMQTELISIPLWTCYHNFPHVQMSCQMAYSLAKDKRHAGFVYAGFTKSGLLKVGMTSKQCPFCRMDQQRLSYEGLVFSEKVFEHEASVIHECGTPIKGREWFDAAEPRLNMLIDKKLLHNVRDVEIEFCRSQG